MTQDSHEKAGTHIDPVCGMEVTAATAAARTCHLGLEIFFCAQACKDAFVADPMRYAKVPKKGFWRRYLDRLTKATGGRPQSCH